jgi:hypothetical protein
VYLGRRAFGNIDQLPKLGRHTIGQAWLGCSGDAAATATIVTLGIEYFAQTPP